MTKTMPSIVGMASLALAAVIVGFAGRPRRVYSGIVFAIIGVLSVANARRKPWNA